MESAFTVTIPVRINKIVGSALLGTSWPTSMISVSFAQRLKLTVMPPNNQEDRVHRTSSKTYGRAIVRIETGGLSANLLVNIVDICVDALLGLDALSEFQAVIQIGVRYTRVSDTSSTLWTSTGNVARKRHHRRTSGDGGNK